MSGTLKSFLNSEFEFLLQNFVYPIFAWSRSSNPWNRYLPSRHWHALRSSHRKIPFGACRSASTTIESLAWPTFGFWIGHAARLRLPTFRFSGCDGVRDTEHSDPAGAFRAFCQNQTIAFDGDTSLYP